MHTYVHMPFSVTQDGVTLICLLIVSVAQQQVDFLLLRRQAFLRAALRSKQMKVSSGLSFVFLFPRIAAV